MDKFNYHTSPAQQEEIEPCKSSPLFERINFHTSLTGSNIAINNLKKLNNKLDENSVVTLAYLANNPYINESEREEFEKQMKKKALEEYEIYLKEIEKYKINKIEKN